MNLNDWFDKGKSLQTYRQSLTKFYNLYTAVYHNFKMPEDGSFFEEIKKKNLRVLVLAEPWCPHCVLNIAVLKRITEATKINVHFLHRDDHLELMDQHLTNGKSRSIPIFLILDEEGELVGKWGPIAEKTKMFLEPRKQQLPAKDDSNYQKAFMEFVSYVTESFETKEEIWQWGYEDIKRALQNA
ncbi:thioredoxin family protein [Aciduricibacillus chroicocephali]|uniref:Thioredoxin family protein n=1 Tax=Aciduricibacillus chroicocephali TaxID=3054939 RepID=A0ABY9KV15_9BACI|nr:thioredoxin family protein [Bacillaceae bacterium 44XB]